jgi:hypothetical protein
MAEQSEISQMNYEMTEMSQDLDSLREEIKYL